MKPDIEAIKARNLDNATLQIAVRGDVLESSKDISALLAYIDSLERVREPLEYLRQYLLGMGLTRFDRPVQWVDEALAAAEGGK